jgi:hypothetical protein
MVALLAWTLPAMAEVKFGGQYRLRMESRDFTDFNDPPAGTNNTLAFYGQRVRLWGIANPTDDTTVKITLQDTRVWGEMGEAAAGGPQLTDVWENMTDLHEAYLQINDFFGYPVGVKMGRQELAYGDERLVGSFGWSNNGRSFDALKLVYSSDAFDADLWTAKLDDDNWDTVIFGDRDEDADFYGLYGVVKSIPDNTLDVYALWYRDGEDAGGTTPEITADLWTYGARLKGAAVGIDYTVEYALQSGDVADTATCDAPSTTLTCDVDADALAIKLGYAIPGAPYSLRVGAEYDLASGDGDASDADIETFFNLYPTNHDKLGYMDLQGWRNVQAWNLNVSGKLTNKLTARLDYWDLSLDEAVDGWYAAGNWNNNTSGIRATCAACTDDELGQELDITLNYKYNDAIGIMAGVSQFYIGDAVEERVGGTDEEDQTWMYAQVTANF